MRFDLTDLRLFVAVIEAGSITHGAARANLALPSASERLRGMEEVSGMQLLERHRRGVAPTKAGEALAHHARMILRQIEQMQGELGSYAKGLKGNIRLLANTASIAEFLPARLASFLASRPHISIELEERASVEIVKAVAGGLAEIGIVSDAVDAGNLELAPFALDRLVVVAAPDHWLASAKSIALADILGENFVGLAAGSPLQEHIDEHGARLGHTLSFRVRVRTFEGVCSLVARNVGIGIVPVTAAQRCRRSLSIRHVGLSDAWARRLLSVCFRNYRELSPLSRDLVEHLRAVTKP